MTGTIVRAVTRVAFHVTTSGDSTCGSCTAAELVRAPSHVVRLRAQHEGTAVTELELRYLQLHALARNHRPVLAPVELERFPRRKHERHKRAAPCGLRQLLLHPAPRSGKGRHPIIGSRIAKLHEIR